MQRMQPQKSIFRKSFEYIVNQDSKLRRYLAKRPLLYTFVGGVAVVLFWRGVWHTADTIPFLSGPVSIIIGGVILLITGLFAYSFFVGEEIMVSDIKKEEKVVAKAEGEIKKEEMQLSEMKETLADIRREINHIHQDHEFLHEQDAVKEMAKD